MEIKESYKERLSESGDNSRLIVMIRANWMTLEFSKCVALPVRMSLRPCALYILNQNMHIFLQLALKEKNPKIPNLILAGVFSIRNSL